MRKIISALFADLAGFTSHTERTDPEDVNERLTSYHTQVRTEVERFGGRVEKLMGDGVFAVFGVPLAHEDDPERAVRAALRIQEAVADLNRDRTDLELSVRVAVTTGEAIVQLSDRPDREGIVGDVVNTASRLQQVAPAGGVVVDKRTQHSTRVAIAYRELEPVQVKGKSEPIAIWLAVEAKSRFGVAFGAEQTSIFIGREHEMGLLTEAFRRATSLSSPQLVTIIGEPGVGKSRLVHELYRWIDDQPDLIWWRQGRCLSYGDGVSFWALGEIVKSHAGILESEPPDQASIKLEAAVAALIEDEADARWVLSRLQPLAGIGKAEAERSELFTAWLRFLEAIAARGPLVMVVEDLHWADEAMLEFLEHLLDGARDAPILLVGTARPELYGVRPNWGGGRPDAATIGLKPLSPTETAHLVAALSKRPLMAAPAQQALLEAAAAIPYT
jgi:class 3 adenylate cyclase